MLCLYVFVYLFSDRIFYAFLICVFGLGYNPFHVFCFVFAHKAVVNYKHFNYETQA